MGKYSQKCNTYTQKFKRENYDTLTVYVLKGKREDIKNYAASVGHSLNSFINTLICNELESQSLKKEKQ